MAGTDSGSEKRACPELDEEDNVLPKRFKAMEPDVTIVIAGKEFYHYKYDLCEISDFFDNMLAANMRESKENRIEFKDKNPDEWVDVYRLLKSRDVKIVLRDHVEGRMDFLFKSKAAYSLAWLDYLGETELLEQLDTLLAQTFKRHYVENPSKFPGYSISWKMFKYLNCPQLQATLLGQMMQHLEQMAKYSDRYDNLDDDLKKYLLDDLCGDEVWGKLISVVNFPERMLQEMDKQTIVTSPTFPYLLEKCTEPINYV